MADVQATSRINWIVVTKKIHTKNGNFDRNIPNFIRNEYNIQFIESIQCKYGNL